MEKPHHEVLIGIDQQTLEGPLSQFEMVLDEPSLKVARRDLETLENRGPRSRP